MAKTFKERLFNLVDKKVLKNLYKEDQRSRRTISFYRYYPIVPKDYLNDMRNDMYRELQAIEVLGRIYISSEGINAQISVLESRYDELVMVLDKYPFAKDITLNEAVEEPREKFSFYKLKIKVRKKIVADGLNENEISFNNPEKRGQHLSPAEFHQLMNEQSESVLPVDVRNHYESEVGHFKNAFCVDADTFRDQLPILKDKLIPHRNKKLLLYCTGGIRCEKAGAYLKQQGFDQVYQLKGGIINYTHYVKKRGVPSAFVGKNFVFDGRLGERVTEDVIATCHQCGSPCDDHTNCANDACHLLFIQCANCKEKFNGCCTPACMEVVSLPLAEQRKIRRTLNAQNRKPDNSLAVYKSRIRPKLRELVSVLTVGEMERVEKSEKDRTKSVK